MSKDENGLAPIVVFAYNRPRHLQQTIEALLKNHEAARSDLFIFSDGPRAAQAEEAVKQVRQYAKSIDGFKSQTLIERQNNYGLGKSIIDGVSFILGQHNKIIVLEDDLVTSPFFLKFMNDGLNCYETEERVASIHGYALPVRRKLPDTFFVRGADCLGWATWKRAWDLFEENGENLLDELQHLNLTRQFDLDGAYPFTQMIRDQIAGKNSSWAVRWHASLFLANKLTLSTHKSLVRHIGNDGTGTNFGIDDMLDTELTGQPIEVGGIPIVESMEARYAFVEFYSANNSTLQRIKKRIKAIYRRIKA